MGHPLPRFCVSVDAKRGSLGAKAAPLEANAEAPKNAERRRGELSEIAQAQHKHTADSTPRVLRVRAEHRDHGESAIGGHRSLLKED
jgi:hypothetical protein